MQLIADNSPEWAPITLDVAAGRIGWARLSEADYRGASFLDERILPQARSVGWTDVAAADEVSASLKSHCDFIFHMGHVGSTLLSRLLGAQEGVFSIREPAVLRTLASLWAGVVVGAGPWSEAQFDRRLAAFVRLYARTWRPSQRSLVKATSFVSDIGAPLIAASARARAILMFTPPRPFIAGLLSGPATRAELTSGAPARLARLHRSLGSEAWRAEALSEGELAAMGWACECVALTNIAGQFPDRVLWLNFEAFLVNPRAGLEAVLRRLCANVDPTVVAAMLSSPDWSRYSKAPQYAFDASLRARLLSQADLEHASEIERGLAWLNAAGNAHPRIATAARTLANASRLG